MKLKRKIFYVMLGTMLLFAQQAQGQEPKQHHHQDRTRLHTFGMQYPYGMHTPRFHHGLPRLTTVPVEAMPRSSSGLKAQLNWLRRTLFQPQASPGVSITPAYSALKGQLNTKIQLMFC